MNLPARRSRPRRPSRGARPRGRPRITSCSTPRPNWARKLAGQAPVAIEQIKTGPDKGDLDDGIAAEKQGFATAFGSEDAREGIGAFIQKRKAKFKGK